MLKIKAIRQAGTQRKMDPKQQINISHYLWTAGWYQYQYRC